MEKNFSVRTHNTFVINYARIALFVSILILGSIFYTIISEYNKKSSSDFITLALTAILMLGLLLLSINAQFDRINFKNGFLSWNKFLKKITLKTELIKDINFIEKSLYVKVIIFTKENKQYVFKINNDDAINYLVELKQTIIS